jgi:Mg2+ and Co2+ transporter CorA
MNKLTKLGTIFLPPTLVAGFFGMNIFSEGSIDNIAGFFLSFILMFGLTYKIAANHNINIREFFFSPKNKNKEK